MFFKKEETQTHNIYKIGKLKFKFRKTANNKIFIIDKNGVKKRAFFVKGLKIKFKGANAQVVLYKPFPKFIRSEIVCGNNSQVEIKSSIYKITKLKIQASKNSCVCKLGSNFSCQNKCTLLLNKEKNKNIIIGDNCMFGSNVVIRTTDSHPIYDKETNELINLGGDVIIGNNVWLGMNVTVLKNTKIADGCVVGTCSVVTKDCLTPDSIYVGTPAKLIKQNIKWSREFEEMD